MGKIRRIITAFLIFVGLVLITIVFIQAIDSKSNKGDSVSIEENKPLFVGDSNQINSGEYIAPFLYSGRYYLNGNKSNYYFEVKTGSENTIELCCDDKYSLFKKWNPSNDNMTNQLVEFWSKPQKFELIVLTGVHKTILSMDMPISVDNSKIEYVKTGPRLLDERTLSGWGIEGDFVRLDD